MQAVGGEMLQLQRSSKGHLSVSEAVVPVSPERREEVQYDLFWNVEDKTFPFIYGETEICSGGLSSQYF